MERCRRLCGVVLGCAIAGLAGTWAAVASGATGPERIAHVDAGAQFSMALNGPRVLWTEASDDYPRRPALRLRAVGPGARTVELMRQPRPVKGYLVEAEVAASKSCIAINVDEWQSVGGGESDIAYTVIRAGFADGPFPIVAGSLAHNGVSLDFDVSGSSVAWIARAFYPRLPLDQAYVRDCRGRRPSRPYGQVGAIEAHVAGDWVAVEYGVEDSKATSIAVYRRRTGTLAYEIPLTTDLQATDISERVPWGLLAGGRVVLAAKSTLMWASPSHPALRTLGAHAVRTAYSPWWIFTDEGALYTRRTGPKTDHLVVQRLDGTIEWSSPPIAHALVSRVRGAAFDGHRVAYAVGSQILLARVARWARRA